ncbi:cytidine deaminase [Phycomyces nitens]|nr:cytidine deaminase [Phycomyces nitens]
MPAQELTQEAKQNLVNLAIEAKSRSYSPYSKFRVGAALLTEDGTLFQGANIENASFGATVCAERTTYCKAISEGHTKFVALAVSSDEQNYISPCGICRQFISEFGPDDLPVLLSNTKGEFTETTIEGLLPFIFRLDH